MVDARLALQDSLSAPLGGGKEGLDRFKNVSHQLAVLPWHSQTVATQQQGSSPHCSTAPAASVQSVLAASPAAPESKPPPAAAVSASHGTAAAEQHKKEQACKTWPPACIFQLALPGTSGQAASAVPEVGACIKQLLALICVVRPSIASSVQSKCMQPLLRC